jgi:hypothetical protein
MEEIKFTQSARTRSQTDGYDENLNSGNEDQSNEEFLRQGKVFKIFANKDGESHGYKIGERLRNIGAKEATWTVERIFCREREETMREVHLVNDQTGRKKYVTAINLDLYWVRVPEEAPPVRTWTPEGGWVRSTSKEAQ